MALSGRSTLFRLFLLLGSFAIFLFAFFPLHSSISRSAALAPLAIPMLMAAWFYGLRGALIASLVSIPVSIMMITLADDTLTSGTILLPLTMSNIFRIAVACLLGRLKDVYHQVKKSEAALEIQVATRTEELSKQREILVEGQSLAKFATTQRDLQTGEGWWSEEVYNILGLAPQESTPTMEDFLERVHPHDAELMQEMIAKTRKTGHTEGEFRIIRSSGEELTLYGQAKTHYDEEGNPVRVIATLMDITAQQQAKGKLLEYQEQLKRLASQLTLAEEQERKRIATELHDRIGQTLAVSRMKLGVLRKNGLSGTDARLSQELDELIGNAIQDTRSLTFELSPPTLYELGLGPTLEWLAEHTSQQYGLACEFEDDQQPKPLEQDTCVILFQVVRELLSNVAKHAQSRQTKINLWKTDGQIAIRVEDDGVGFDTSTLDSHGPLKGSFGLFSIRERVGLLGGKFKIESIPGKGTQVVVMAPLKREKERQIPYEYSSLGETT